MIKNSKIPVGAKVGVLGLGVTGKAAVRYVQACGGEAYISDNRPQAQFEKEEEKFLKQQDIAWEAGGHTREFLAQLDLILVSPGINLNRPLFDSLKADGVEIAGELAIAAGHINAPVIGITGTNGKTTVTTLVGNIFKHAGKKVFVGGNIGNPLYYYLLCPEEYELLVLELSSFQLDSGGEFAPDLGILLNVSPDHLDWHGSMGKYLEAKKKLFVNQKAGQQAIVNGDDAACTNLVEEGKAERYTFGVQPGNICQIGSEKISLCLHSKKEDYHYKEYGNIQGVNRMNFAAAILASRLFGLSAAEVCLGLQTFQFLPHRLEYVDEIDGVAYFNDSKATNTGAVLGALAQFTKNVILIAGGRDKGDDYGLLREMVSEKVEAIVVLGEAAELIAAALSGVTQVKRVRSMEEAVLCASALAIPGGSVLLSPGCASFDMFSSYGHRGNEFKNEVAKLRSTEQREMSA